MNAFFLRHEFLIRRLHSLSGLVPVGAYMSVHLAVNSTLINGAGRFQANVNAIHDLGGLLPTVEWLFIFFPIIFHAAVGIWISRTGHSNVRQYGFAANRRYTWQRYTAYIAIIFIFTHVFHLHGWFHNEWWMRNVAEPLGMAKFRPYNAASTLAIAFSGIVWPIFYTIGILASCFHLANGIWTAGITWGAWVSPAGQKRALWACSGFGIILVVLGMTSLISVKETDVAKARATEDRMYDARVESGELLPNPEKRSSDPLDSGIMTREPTAMANSAPGAETSIGSAESKPSRDNVIATPQ